MHNRLFDATSRRTHAPATAVGGPWRGRAAGFTSLRTVMARRSLRPGLNRIRAWVRQGRTAAWIAHQLDVTVQQIAAFKREQGLVTGEEPNGAPGDYEIALRAEDDALIAAELDAAEAEAEAEAEKANDSDDDESDDEDDRH